MTINLITREYYIGVHKTSNPNDGYLGSGLIINRSIKKYGRDKFIKIIIGIYNTIKEAFEAEIKYIECCKKDSYCVNIASGGQGGPLFAGKRHTQKTREKISKMRLGVRFKKSPLAIEQEKLKRYQRNGGVYFSEDTLSKIKEKAKNRSKESYEKISKTMKGRKINKNSVYCRTDETKEKQSKIMIEKYSQIYKNLIWVKNIATGHSLRIASSELDNYISLGYIRGRFLSFK